MIKHNNLQISTLLLLLILSSILQAEEWYAMARHGECIELVKITDRTDIIKGAKAPSEIEDMLKKAGIDYILEPMHKEFKGMLTFTVPSKEWAMVLVKKKYCKEFISR
ncbi:MAG: hypothetical protein KZQ83_10830 [gamma proteobacterium symbiont of Taylorina sp.]|nr:hypothetical protein [gamma proteobacterium symbiont of Taylorina sp.]